MDKDVKKIVQEFYGGIAQKASRDSKASCCCNSSCCGDSSVNSQLYDPEHLKGLPLESINMSLGCANPIALAQLKEGEKVLDLGSGGGIDVLIASKYIGESGKVYGLDMTEEMLIVANKNKERMGADNVEFLKGYLEDIPLTDNQLDVILSNCVINLTEDKEKALKEAYRVLKPGGRLAIADIVVLKEIPHRLKKSVEAWVGCVAGALTIAEYQNVLEKAGFKEIEIKPVNIYTKEVIRGMLEQFQLENDFQEFELAFIDGAFAGAHVKAIK